MCSWMGGWMGLRFGCVVLMMSVMVRGGRWVLGIKKRVIR